jgi:hypothetical protein
MSNALFAFEDRSAGERAASRLLSQGLPPAAVQVNAHDIDTHARQFDEQATGGLITNLLDLFQGVFDWGKSPHDAAAYEETVRRGGAVVTVEARTDSEREAVDELMLAAGCTRHTDWSELPPH